MATPATQLDASEVRERVLEVIRSLLEELGSRGALPMLSGASQLDRDLGLGSLERVELLARLETAFGVRLPDQRRSGSKHAGRSGEGPSNSAGSGDAGRRSGLGSARSCHHRKNFASEAKDTGVFSTETLLDVLRYRAMHDAERTHLLITEEMEGQETQRDADVWRTLLGGAALRRGIGTPRCACGRTSGVDAADFARVFCFVCGNFAGRRDSRADLSAVSRRSHRGICVAAVGDFEKCRRMSAADVSSSGSGGAAC